MKKFFTSEDVSSNRLRSQPKLSHWPKDSPDDIDDKSTTLDRSDISTSASSPELNSSSDSSPETKAAEDRRKFLRNIEASKEKLRREMKEAEEARRNPRPDNRPLGYPHRPSFIVDMNNPPDWSTDPLSEKGKKVHFGGSKQNPEAKKKEEKVNVEPPTTVVGKTDVYFPDKSPLHPKNAKKVGKTDPPSAQKLVVILKCALAIIIFVTMIALNIAGLIRQNQIQEKQIVDQDKIRKEMEQLIKTRAAKSELEALANDIAARLNQTVLLMTEIKAGQLLGNAADDRLKENEVETEEEATQPNPGPNTV